jgi:hypothetical protein
VTGQHVANLRIEVTQQHDQVAALDTLQRAVQLQVELLLPVQVMMVCKSRKIRKICSLLAPCRWC